LDQEKSGNPVRHLSDDVWSIDAAEQLPEVIEKVADKVRVEAEQVEHQELKKSDQFHFDS
jgi:hypothetical protein